jgi:predicted DNA-binding protein YlxM (UPF0122 family)
VQEIADIVRVPRTTIYGHLNKTENKRTPVNRSTTNLSQGTARSAVRPHPLGSETH